MDTLCGFSRIRPLSPLPGVTPVRPYMNFLLDHLPSGNGNVPPCSPTHLPPSLSLGHKASSAFGKLINFIGNSPLSINSSYVGAEPGGI